MLQMPDGNTTVIIQGKKRFEMGEVVQTEPYLKARVTAFGELKTKADKKFDALVNSVKDLAMQIIETSPNIPTEAGIAIKNRSEEHTSELQSLMRISYAVFS